MCRYINYVGTGELDLGEKYYTKLLKDIEDYTLKNL